MRKREDTRPLWVTDAETDPFLYGRVPEPFVWGLYTGAGFHTFDDTAELVEAIQGQEVVVYAHNGGKFDFHLMLRHLNLREPLKVIDGRIVSAKVGQAELRDSYSLFPAPLRSFAGKLDIDYRKLEAPVRARHMPEIIRYLRADCVELWEKLDQHERTYGRHLTQASASMAWWRQLSGIAPPKTDRAFFEKFSRFYYGGRVQVFPEARGQVAGPFGVWDIRSAYPWAMLSLHPYEPAYFEVAYPRRIEPTDMVDLMAVSAGALPWRTERGGVIYPTDQERRLYHVPGHEVIAAQETGALSEVEYLNACRFTGLRDFAVYIHHFYEKRKVHRTLAKTYRASGNLAAASAAEAETFFAKRYMTGLYGKFAANPDNYGEFELVPWDEKLVDTGDGFTFAGRLGPHALMRKPLEPHQENWINLATAASITSQVRAHLWRAIDGAQGVLYCDTDCIMAKDASLPIGEELGEWNLEGTASAGWFAGKKLYYLKGASPVEFDGKGEKMASKGVRPDPEAIKRAAMGEVVTVRSDAPTFTLRPRKDGAGVYFQERRIRATGI